MKLNESEFLDNLTKDLAKKTEELKEKKKSKMVEIVDLKIPEEQLTPADLFMALNETEIARQFTLIEYKIFCKIKVMMISLSRFESMCDVTRHH